MSLCLRVYVIDVVGFSAISNESLSYEYSDADPTSRKLLTFACEQPERSALPPIEASWLAGGKQKSGCYRWLEYFYFSVTHLYFRFCTPLPAPPYHTTTHRQT